MVEMILETTARELQTGKIAGALGVITGLPSMTWAALQGDWIPAYAGSATGIAGVLFFLYKQGEDRRIKMMADAMAAMTLELSGQRDELKAARREAEAADEMAIEERRKLRVEIEELRVHNARLMAGMRRVENHVENIAANPAVTNTPDPDVAKEVS